MIIVRSPLRVSFFGGGTDHPAWIDRGEKGAVLSTSIDKYIYIQLRRLPAVFDFNYRVAWGMLEEVDSINEIEHPVVREVLKYYAGENETGYEIIHNSDLPSKSGLGSSSAFTVSLLHAFHGNQELLCSKRRLAKEAIFVEQKLLGETVGYQDQIASAHGGLNRIDFNADGDYDITPIHLTGARKTELEDSMMLFFTGFTRYADAIEKRKVAQFGDRTKELRAIYDMVGEGERILTTPECNLAEFGELLHETWVNKRKLDASVTNPMIDERYEAARRAGALGGKLLGAGGGGFLLMFVPPDKRAAVTEAMAGMVHVPLRMERTGTSVVLYDPDLTSNYLAAGAKVS
ncbi:kinase [Hyphomonas johnsonii]|uniref:GHMP kinase n=1 Tax=Hyphomonas johnsonii MHS-2 TaxID=1280950 RepID=A0A059FVP4_9PROT|nr:kinase [Hyphomonas johnsonii]KCZ94541.1 GHMP kinase [Hyphomonas johnsonii MHS-2]